MKKIAIFASGSGTNFQAIVNSIKNKEIKAEIALLVCDNPNAFVIIRAKKENINTFVFNPKNYINKENYEKDIIKELKKHKIEFIALAGYMRIIGKNLLKEYNNKIINIHPSLLPAFKGKDAIKKAYEYGVKVTGVTIHYIDEGIDTGKIIAQEVIKISENETLDEVEKRIHEIEHLLYPSVLKNILEN